MPTIWLDDLSNKFTPNKLEEKGVYVEQDFEYNSGTNKDFLSLDALIEFNRQAGFS